jgi:ApaG protein
MWDAEMLTTTIDEVQPIWAGGHAERLDVIVTLTAYYLAERAAARLFPWGYQYRIFNGSDEPFEVERRSWRMVQARGRRQGTFHAPTITGKRPIIWPGEWSEWFRTGVPLECDTGSMRGWLHCRILSTGEKFDIKIEKFHLNASNPGVVPKPARSNETLLIRLSGQSKNTRLGLQGKPRVSSDCQPRWVSGTLTGYPTTP